MAFIIQGISYVTTAVTGAKYAGKAARFMYDCTPPLLSLSGKEHPVVLDPITTLALTALMPFKESNSRIALKDTHIEIQQPSEYQYVINWQWLARTLQMASREDLEVIREAIIKAADWFEPQNNEVITSLFAFAQEGLASLHQTYESKSGTTCSAIREWQGLIDQATTEGLKWQPQSMKEEQNVNEASLKVKSIWSESDIATLNSLLQRAKERQGRVNPNIRVLCKTEINTIETLLKGKTKELTELLQKSDS